MTTNEGFYKVDTCLTLRGATFHQGRMRGFRIDLGSSLGKGATTPSMMTQKANTVAKTIMPMGTFMLIVLSGNFIIIFFCFRWKSKNRKK
jgi:hypothetical protein